ncbi:hypothetical protein VNO77_21152 [Canavalia gladiata]|uniref:glucan endo-1,3-beta-D-glucosidase n=1 Tax=Canavalia gladiata TaxID=3824 RepID=A0AAN9LU27_CANGL
MVTILAIQLPVSRSIGINYGRIADNLPSPKDVAQKYKSCGIQLLRLFEPSPDVLEALKGSNLQVSLGTRNEDIQASASSPEAASQWVNTNVAPYKNDVNFKYIVLGNEVIPGPAGPSIAPALKNMHNAINSIGLTSTKVTTSIMMPAVEAPLMVNAYPYYAYSGDSTHNSLEYVTFQATNPVVTDGDLKYFNLFDAMVDSVYSALEKVGGAKVPIVIGETGWPTAGNEPYSSKQNAQTFNQNLLKYAQAAKGTPKRPGQPFDIFLFAMFNEDLKQSGIERNWGIFNTDTSPIYPLLQC